MDLQDSSLDKAFERKALQYRRNKRYMSKPFKDPTIKDAFMFAAVMVSQISAGHFWKWRRSI